MMYNEKIIIFHLRVCECVCVCVCLVRGCVFSGGQSVSINGWTKVMINEDYNKGKSIILPQNPNGNAKKINILTLLKWLSKFN